jgi:drug/metabolite transporter (DMT)-like permease
MKSQTSIGVWAGIGAGAVWGLAFIGPRALPEFGASFVALGRFFFFGLISAVLLFRSYSQNPKKFRANLPKGIIQRTLIMAVMGNSLYYLTLVYGVRLIGVPACSLIIGVLPLSIAYFGYPGKFPKKLAPPLFVIFVGVLLINWGAFDLVADSTLPKDPLLKALGLGSSLLGLVMWTYYGIENSRYLKANPKLDAGTWSSLLGVASLLTMLPLNGLEWISGLSSLPDLSVLSTDAWIRYFGWSAVLGLGASWFAYMLWNVASLNLPTSLCGQLIVSETFFALVFSFIFEGVWPNGVEVASALCLMGGVLWSLKIFSKPHLLQPQFKQ